MLPTSIEIKNFNKYWISQITVAKLLNRYFELGPCRTQIVHDGCVSEDRHPCLVLSKARDDQKRIAFAEESVFIRQFATPHVAYENILRVVD